MNEGLRTTKKNRLMLNPLKAVLLYGLSGVVIYWLAYLHHHRKNSNLSAREEGLFVDSPTSDSSLREHVEFRLIQLVAGFFCLLVWPIVSVVLLWHKLRPFFASADSDDYPIYNCRIEHLVTKTSLAMAEIAGQIEDPTGLTPRQPFGYLYPAWVEFCSGADFESEIWRFRIPKGARYGPDSRLAHMDILGYAIVNKEAVIAEFIVEFH